MSDRSRKPGHKDSHSYDPVTFEIASTYESPARKKDEISPFSSNSICRKPISSMFVINGPVDEKFRGKVDNVRSALTHDMRSNALQANFGALTLESVEEQRAKFGSYGDGASAVTVPGLVKAFSDFSVRCDSSDTVCIFICGYGINTKPDILFHTDLGEKRSGGLSFMALFNVLSFVRRTPMAVFVATDHGALAAKHMEHLPRKSVLFGLSRSAGITDGMKVDNWMTRSVHKGWPEGGRPLDLLMTYLFNSDITSKDKPVIASGRSHRWPVPPTASAINGFSKGIMVNFAEYYKFPYEELLEIFRDFVDFNPKTNIDLARLGTDYGKVLALAIYRKVFEQVQKEEEREMAKRRI